MALWKFGFDLNIFYCFNIYMYKQKGRATSSSNISYGPSQNLGNLLTNKTWWLFTVRGKLLGA